MWAMLSPNSETPDTWANTSYNTMPPTKYRACTGTGINISDSGALGYTAENAASTPNTAPDAPSIEPLLPINGKYAAAPAKPEAKYNAHTRLAVHTRSSGGINEPSANILKPKCIRLSCKNMWVNHCQIW